MPSSSSETILSAANCLPAAPDSWERPRGDAGTNVQRLLSSNVILLSACLLSPSVFLACAPVRFSIVESMTQRYATRRRGAPFESIAGNAGNATKTWYSWSIRRERRSNWRRPDSEARSMWTRESRETDRSCNEKTRWRLRENR